MASKIGSVCIACLDTGSGEISTDSANQVVLGLRAWYQWGHYYHQAV